MTELEQLRDLVRGGNCIRDDGGQSPCEHLRAANAALTKELEISREQLDAAREALNEIAIAAADGTATGQMLQAFARAALGVVAAAPNQTTDSVSAPSKNEGRAGGSDAS